MPRFVRSGYFWAGVVTGVVVGPWVINRVAPKMRPNIPQQS